MNKTIWLVLAWIARILVIAIILWVIVVFLVVCGIAAGIGGFQ